MDSWQFTVSFDTFEISFPFQTEEQNTIRIAHLVQWISDETSTSGFCDLICCMTVDETARENDEEYELYTELEEIHLASPAVIRDCQLAFYYLHDMGVLSEEQFGILIGHIWSYCPPAYLQ